MKVLLAAYLTFALFTPVTCHAWGTEGHRIVADLAQVRLTPQTRETLRELMGTDDIARWATWADDIKQEQRDTAPWHYVDIPGNSKGYKAKRDCPDRDCVVGKIEQFSAILRDPRQPVPARREALKFLVHFVGDVHQPFHAIGDARGANEVRWWNSAARGAGSVLANCMARGTPVCSVTPASESIGMRTGLTR
jgi:hypothetical protein